MKNLIETLDRKKTGYGHFYISIDFDGHEVGTTTTNTLAIDAAFDDCYDDVDNSGRYYENRLEAQEELVNEILRKNDIELLNR
jgi:phage-related protein